MVIYLKKQFPLILQVNSKIQTIQSLLLLTTFPSSDGDIKIYRKLAAVSRKQKNIRRSASHRTHLFKELLRSMSCKCLRRLKAESLKSCLLEISRTESCILGALSKLDDFLLHPQVRTLSGTVPGTSRNIDMENQEAAGDRSQNDSYPELVFSACRFNKSNDSDPKENSDKEVFIFLQDIMSFMSSCSHFVDIISFIRSHWKFLKISSRFSTFLFFNFCSNFEDLNSNHF